MRPRVIVSLVLIVIILSIAISPSQLAMALETYTNLLTWGTFGSLPGQFRLPHGIATDSAGNVYTVELHNHRVQKFDSNGNFLMQFGSFGSGDGQFSGPKGISLDSAGNIYVADRGNHRIQKFNSAGVFLGKFGTGGSAPGQFLSPDGVAVDSAGNIYVADTGNNRIQKFSPTFTFLSTWGSLCVLVPGPPSPSCVDPDGLGPLQLGDGQFQNPYDLTIDSLGNVYVIEGNNHRVQKFTSSGTFLVKWGSFGSADGQFSTPFGIGVDSSNNVFVADSGNHRIQKFTSTGTLLAKFGGSGQFSMPSDVAVGPSNNVFVADRDQHQAEKWGLVIPAPNPPPFSLNYSPIYSGPTCLQMEAEEPGIHYWFIKPDASGALTINVNAVSVNPIDESGSIKATLFDGATNLGTTTVLHPVSPSPIGSANTGAISFAADPTKIYRLEIVAGPIIPPQIQQARHYSLEVVGGTADLGINSPSQRYFEHELEAFHLNVNSGESLALQISVDSPPANGVNQASSITLEIRSSANALLHSQSATPISPGSPINVLLPAAASADSRLLLINGDGHFRVTKTSGTDTGLYVDGCPPKDGTQCDDGNACTTNDSFVMAQCIPGDPLNPDDNNACTADSCDPSTGVVHTPIDPNDNNACTADSCDPASGTTHTPLVCADDGNVCTVEACDPTTGCFTSNVADGTSCGSNMVCSSGQCVATTTVTRTQGFWSTHLDAATQVWNSLAPSDRIIGTKNMGNGPASSDVSEMMGGFWSNIAKKSDNSKRTALDQARMQLAQQLIAAMLNKAAFATDDGGLVAQGKTAFAGTNIAAIQSAQSALAAFNEGGDTQSLPSGFNQGSADPNAAKATANKAFWNTLP